MKFRKIVIAAAAMSALFALTSCSGGSGRPVSTPSARESDEPSESATLDPELTANTIDAVITLTNGDEISLELYPDAAPKTVANFVKNVQENFYSGTIFHRAEKGFVIQAGGYDAEFKPKSVSETVEGEFEENGIENDISHVRGVISMARPLSSLNGASTQFFIVLEDSTYLDGQYAAFGRVTDGMDVVDEIGNSDIMADPPAGLENVPEETYEIQSITITSGAENLEEPSEEPEASEKTDAVEMPGADNEREKASAEPRSSENNGEDEVI